MSNSIATDVVSFTKSGVIILVSLDAHGDKKKGLEKEKSNWKKRHVTRAMPMSVGPCDGRAHSDDGTNSIPLISKSSALSSPSSRLAGWAVDP